MGRISRETRSRIMSAVKGRNTIPERLVRSRLHREGFRFRVYGKGLPGTPDIVLTRYGTIVFVNGCFWHGHRCRKGSAMPKTRTEYWKNKIERDLENRLALKEAGWKVFVVWTCRIDSDLAYVMDYLQVCRGSRNGPADKIDRLYAIPDRHDVVL